MNISLFVARVFPILLAAACCGSAIAQTRIDDKDEVVEQFEQVESLQGEQRWGEAAHLLQQILSEYPKSKNRDIFTFSLGKSLLHSGNITDAQRVLRDFVVTFDRSPHLAHGYYFSAVAAQSAGELAKTFEYLLLTYAASSDVRLDSLVERRLSDQGFSTFAAQPEIVYDMNRTKQCQIYALLGEQPFKHHRQLYQHMMSNCTGRQRAKSQVDNQLSIAVALPFTGELKDFGEEIYSGAVVAAELMGVESSVPISITPYDTRSNSIEAGRLIRQLLDTHADAIIGPLSSEEVAVAAASIGKDTLPMIAPVAGGSGLTELSVSLFQLTPSLDAQAAALANYARQSLRARTAAILTSNSEEHLRLAEVFKEKFRFLGGKIVAEQYYRPRDKDFSGYLRDLKGALRGKIDTSGTYLNDKGDTLAANTVPASVDCLYMPGTPSQLKQLLPQVNFFNIRSAYLGSESWSDNSVLSLTESVTRGAIFPAAALDQPTGYEYDRFVVQYEGRFGRKPEKLAYRGYDAVVLLSRAAASAGPGRATILRALLDQGNSGDEEIRFNSSRVSTNLQLYRIDKGTPIPVVSPNPAPLGGGEATEEK